MAYLGHPLLGDQLYGPGGVPKQLLRLQGGLEVGQGLAIVFIHHDWQASTFSAVVETTKFIIWLPKLL